MDAISFRNAMEDAKPDIDSLARVGLSAQESADFISSYEIVDRSLERGIVLPDPVLDELISNNDSSKIEIGFIKFSKIAKESHFGWIIGEAEADYLFIDRGSLEINVRYFDDESEVIWRCAEDGNRFLDAMVIAARYFTDCIEDDKNGTLMQQNAFNECVRLAGGNVYSSFYAMLLNVF